MFVITVIHYSDVTMSAMASQITGIPIVCSTVFFRHRSNLRVTGLFSGESTGDRWIPPTKASNVKMISHLIFISRRAIQIESGSPLGNRGSFLFHAVNVTCGGAADDIRDCKVTKSGLHRCLRQVRVRCDKPEELGKSQVTLHHELWRNGRKELNQISLKRTRSAQFLGLH